MTKLIRTSGLWMSPNGFHNFAILQRRVSNDPLTGTAPDCQGATEITLKRIGWG